MKLISQERIFLKHHPDINEKVIQDYICENPDILGLGDLEPLKKERKQPLGGRLDILFRDDNDDRYEVELQLGATDPSHIIRTIEYWDTERKRYPQYNHTAVIIAEDITSRFQNVISLFNNSIPIIALQLNAVKTTEGDISLSFVKVMDVIAPGTEEEIEEEPTDRNYWEKRASKKTMTLIDDLFDRFELKENGLDKKYNKFYVGVQKGGVTRNFVSFRPKKAFIYVVIKSEEINEATDSFNNHGLDFVYDNKWKEYRIKINDISEFDNCKEEFLMVVNNAKERYGIE